MIRFLLLSGTLVSVLTASAQNFKINAPNSAFGVGEYFDEGTARNRAMGGLGVSTSNKLFVNLKNPALYSHTKYTVFEAGIIHQLRRLKSGSATRTDGDVIPIYLAISFPISKSWKSGFSLSPYTYSNYSSYTNTSISGSTTGETITTTLEGTGGLNKVSFHNGVSIGSDFSLGLSASYIFGKQEINQMSELSSSSSNNYTTLEQEYVYKGFQFKTGVAFRKELRKVTVPSRSKLVVPNPNYLPKKRQVETCMDSLAQTKGRDNIKENLKLCKEQLLDIPKKIIYEDTLVNKDVFLAKNFIDSVSSTATYGNYFIFIPTYSELLYDPSVKSKVLKIKIKNVLKANRVTEYGIFVKKEILEASEDEWTAELTKLIDGTFPTVENKDNHLDAYLKRKSGIFFNSGFSFQFGSSLDIDAQRLENTYTSRGFIVVSDTTSIENGKARLPFEITFGISLDKPEARGKRKNGSLRKAIWSVGTEVFFINGDNYTHIKGNDLVNSYGMRIGTEVIPDLNAKQRSDYFKRVFYRFGGVARNLPYEQNNKAVTDIGLTFGLGLPIGYYDFRLDYPKYVNLSFEFGKRGALNKGQITENYFFTTLALTINDKWFKRTKIGL